MVYRRRFLSNPYIDFPPSVTPAEPEPVAVVVEEEPVVTVEEEEPVAVEVSVPKAPKRASKAKKTPVAE